jgi:hypothetical protein
MTHISHGKTLALASVIPWVQPPVLQKKKKLLYRYLIQKFLMDIYCLLSQDSSSTSCNSVWVGDTSHT